LFKEESTTKEENNTTLNKKRKINGSESEKVYKKIQKK